MKCEVIQDLLPLYLDGVCSAESTGLVEDHLTSCEACQGVRDGMRLEMRAATPATPDEITASQAVRAILLRWQRSKLLLYVCAAVLAVGVLVTGYQQLFRINAVPIPVARVEVAELWRLSDGNLALRLRYPDGRGPTRANGFSTRTMVKGGECYIEVYGPRISIPTGEAVLSDYITLESHGEQGMVSVYYGMPDDCVLVYESGAEVESLPPEMEEELFYYPGLSPR